MSVRGEKPRNTRNTKEINRGIGILLRVTGRKITLLLPAHKLLRVLKLVRAVVDFCLGITLEA
jgi:hypothetical protein